jgi:LysM repeat protein
VRSKRAGILSGAVALSLLGASAWAQGTPAAAPSGLQTGPATVATHWSKNKYPTSIPDGAAYYIVVKGDTLWDLSKRFLGNPYLWPQIWNQNKYIADAHWIYPGDPIIVPKVSVVSDKAGEPGVGGTGEGEAGEGAAGEGGPGGAGSGSALYAVTEEVTMQCANYIVPGREDESLPIIGSENGATKHTFSERDILYLAKGTNAGIKAGDIFTFHHRAYSVKHPNSGKTLGEKVETTGWGRVILVQENSSTVVVDQSCSDIHEGDYLKPFEKLNVPLALRRPIANRLTPSSGKTQGYVVDMAENAAMAATGQLVSIDLGSDSGVTPGSILVVYRTMYPSVPTPRNVLGEIAVLTAREKTATAKVIHSNDAIMNGDQVELR